MAQPLADECVLLRIAELQKGLFHFTDTTNAYRMLKQYGKDIRFNSLWKKWLVWNGTRWELDDGYLIHDKALEMIRNIYMELGKTTDYRERLEIEKHAMQSESVRRRKAIVEASSWIPELNVKTDQLDKDPFLLNVQNATIDLRTGETYKQKQDDLITRIANVDYDPNADCPTWKSLSWR